ncbi:MAG: GntR family transcriptional regulator [Solirubrobacteraceae bacterium]|jgi:GntR family transcriptional regulator
MYGQLLDRDDPLPLWAQLLRSLRRRLAAGEFTQRFPTDGELMAVYGVSRQTARDAVRRLADEGLVERERGRGTRVRPLTFERAAGTLESLFEYVEERGHEQTSITRACGERTDARAAALLRLPSSAPLIYIERLRLVDGEPLALDRSWLPASVARPLLDSDLTRTGIYVELVSRCGVTLRSGSEQIRPLVLPPGDRRALGLPARHAALAVSRLTVGDAGPVEWRESAIRGDRWSIVVELTPTGRSSAVLPWAPVAA